MSQLITTELLGEHPLLSSISTAENLSTAWIRSGDGLIGFGVYKELEITGPERFTLARNWWDKEVANFTIKNNVHGGGTGPILFTSFAFDESAPSKLIIPQIVIGQKNGKSWITWIGNTAQPEITQLKNSVVSGEIKWADGSISEDKWRNQVAVAIKSINAGELEKVVLARDLNATSTTAIDARQLLKRLEIEYPSTWLFLVDGLVGATPELLVRLSKSLVTSRVLAGTIRKTGDEDRDLTLAASLAKSSKDLEEHEYAVRSVADALAPFCSSSLIEVIAAVLDQRPARSIA